MAKSREAFRTISEVAEWLDVQTHVLRFWESKFSQVKPVKRAGGRRYYRPQDMELLGGLKKLLHEDGMAIKDAQKLLREKGVKHVSSLSHPLDEPAPAIESKAAEAASSTDDDDQAPLSPDTAEDPQQEIAESETETDSTDAADPETAAETETSEADVDGDVSEEEGEASEDTDENASQGEDDLDDLTEVAETPAAAPDLTPESGASAPMGDLFSALEASDVDGAPGAPAGHAPDLAEEAPGDLPESGMTTAAAQAPLSDLDAPQATIPETPMSDAADHRQPGTLADESDAGGVTTTAHTPAEAETSEPAPSGIAETAPAEMSSAPAAPVAPMSETAPASSDESTVEETAEAPLEPMTSDAPETLVAEPDSDETISPKTDDSQAQAAPDKETLVSHEKDRSSLLLTLSKPVELAPENRNRAAELLARLEALHNKAS